MKKMKKLDGGRQRCNKFKYCGAPLCPLDDKLSERIWYSNEKICKSIEYSKGLRWVKKQRSILKRQNSSWLNRPIHYQELVDASQSRQLSLDAFITSHKNIDDEANDIKPSTL